MDVFPVREFLGVHHLTQLRLVVDNALSPKVSCSGKNTFMFQAFADNRWSSQPGFQLPTNLGLYSKDGESGNSPVRLKSKSPPPPPPSPPPLPSPTSSPSYSDTSLFLSKIYTNDEVRRDMLRCGGTISPFSSFRIPIRKASPTLKHLKQIGPDIPRLPSRRASPYMKHNGS